MRTSAVTSHREELKRRMGHSRITCTVGYEGQDDASCLKHLASLALAREAFFFFTECSSAERLTDLLMASTPVPTPPSLLATLFDALLYISCRIAFSFSDINTNTHTHTPTHTSAKRGTALLRAFPVSTSSPFSSVSLLLICRLLNTDVFLLRLVKKFHRFQRLTA